MSPVQEKLKKPDQATHMTVPGDANADLDHFKDTDRQDTLRQQLDKELNEAPWNPDAGQQALEKMEKNCQNHQTSLWGLLVLQLQWILNQLNETAKKLKDRQAEMKKDAMTEVRKKTKCPLLTNATPATAQLDTTCSTATRSPYSMAWKKFYSSCWTPDRPT